MATDKHVIPRYNKAYSMLNTIASKFKNGNASSAAWLPSTVQQTVLRISGGNAQSEGETIFRAWSQLVDGCTDNGIRIRTLTVGRKFFYAGVTGMLKSKNVQFLMPATHTKGFKKTINEFQAGKRDTISQHILISGNGGKRQEKIPLIILEGRPRNGENHPHVCHLRSD